MRSVAVLLLGIVWPHWSSYHLYRLEDGEPQFLKLDTSSRPRFFLSHSLLCSPHLLAEGSPWAQTKPQRAPGTLALLLESRSPGAILTSLGFSERDVSHETRLWRHVSPAAVPCAKETCWTLGFWKWVLGVHQEIDKTGVPWNASLDVSTVQLVLLPVSVLARELS